MLLEIVYFIVGIFAGSLISAWILQNRFAKYSIANVVAEIVKEDKKKQKKSEKEVMMNVSDENK